MKPLPRPYGREMAIQTSFAPNLSDNINAKNTSKCNSLLNSIHDTASSTIRIRYAGESAHCHAEQPSAHCPDGLGAATSPIDLTVGVLRRRY